MIDIRTEKTKYKGTRVDIYRRVRNVNEKTHKVAFSIKRLGSFKLTADKAYPDEFTPLLAPDEIVQLKNWLAEAKFAEQFQEDADTLTKYTLRMPQKLYEAYVALSHEAEQAGLDFIPNQVMLAALLQKATLVEQKLQKLKGTTGAGGVLTALGISTDKRLSEEAYQRLLDVESRSLFQALLDLPQPLRKTCNELEAIANAYGKQKERISPMQLKEWAGRVPGRQLKKVNRWVYAMAIDALLNQGKNPLCIAPPERVTEYWITQYYSQFTLAQAKQVFNQRFQPAPDLKVRLENVIEASYHTV